MQGESEKDMKINYQIMDESQKNAGGRYIPDFEKLIEGASCKDEVSYINEVKERIQKYMSDPELAEYAGFSYEMVYVVRQKCGHFEMFQTSCKSHSVDDILKLAEQTAIKMECTRCISGIGGRA